MSDTTPSDQERRAALLVKVFDLRSFIGSLFIVFGVIVTVDGLVATQEEIDKAAGLNISLWTGIVMFVIGVIFIVWMLTSPPAVERREEGQEDPLIGE